MQASVSQGPGGNTRALGGATQAVGLGSQPAHAQPWQGEAARLRLHAAGPWRPAWERAVWRRAVGRPTEDLAVCLAWRPRTRDFPR